MARFKADALGRLLGMMLVERKATTAREKELIRALNSFLAKMSYQVVELGGRAPARKVRRRRRRRTGRPRRQPARAAKRQAKNLPRPARKRGRPTRARPPKIKKINR